MIAGVVTYPKLDFKRLFGAGTPLPRLGALRGAGRAFSKFCID